ncbi:MAG: inorganic phosphate transporter [Arcobacteraceae bacterium]|jgi:PiT family inorganic phosphate transporter|nr:inorganic phosphate transporter [Arcobacteraceae bacterium]
MDLIFVVLVVTVLAVAIFDFTNGFHDAADMVATAIASRAMTPTTAILIVTIFTFIAPFLAGLTVADTIGNFVDVGGIPILEAQSIVLAGIVSAITYNLVTWKYGLPSSSSNSLIGGLVGAGLYGIGNHSINWGIIALSNGELDGVMKIVAGLFISPIAGLVIGFLLMKFFMKLFSRLTIRNRKFFIWSQYLSISWLGFSHGANDAQKGMGIIAMILFASGYTSSFSVPTWVIVLCASSITLGTMFGGWSIIKTLGFGIIKVKLLHSFTDQIGSAFINSIATSIGAPTSTTQVVTATLIGIGGAEKPKHVKWKVASSIVSNWFTNIPISMALGAFYCMLFVAIFS